MRTLVRLLPLALAGACFCAPVELELVSVKRIWDQAPHSAFTDLVRFRDQWFAVFREGQWHVAKGGQEDDGKLRVIVSKDGESWSAAALIAEKGVDLRDPHFAVTADGRLMIVAGGSRYPEGRYDGRRPRVLFSKDGFRWSKPRAVLREGDWLWRVTWHEGKAYGVAKYGSPGRTMPGNPRRADLVTSADGVRWETITELNVPGADETTLRFLPDGRMVALTRRVWNDGDLAMIGWSRPPYREWQWSKTRYCVGGPNFIVLPTGAMIAGGRLFPNGDRSAAKMALGRMDVASYEPVLELPSGGDTSYPGFVFHDGQLWALYYASHEGKASIYLARLRVT